MSKHILLETAAVHAIDLGDGTVLFRFVDSVQAQTALWVSDALEALAKQAKSFVLEGDFAWDRDEMAGYAQNRDQQGLDRLANNFQKMTGTMRRLNQPVILAFSGSVGSLGMELGLCADGVVGAEVMFEGFLPQNKLPFMAGGLTELALATYAIGSDVSGCDIVPFLKRIFQQLMMGKPCGGFDEAAAKGVLFPAVSVCDKSQLLARAKEKALFMAEEGCFSRQERIVRVSGNTGTAALEMLAINLYQGGFLTPQLFEAAVGMARVLGGGDVPKGTLVPEAQLLKLEREAFAHACIQHMGGEETA